MAVVLEVLHDDLAGGMLEFTDDEVVELQKRPEQIVVDQPSQGGNMTFIYVGQPRAEFDIQFHIFYQSTLEKLEAIRLLRDSFTLRPFALVEPATEYEVFWPQQPTFIERWVRGRRAAQWDFEVTWKETRVTLCTATVES
jgi:hypothetical protein